MMLFLLIATATMKCPTTKTNLVEPWSDADKKAISEHSDRCLSTKHWPCLITFEKKREGWYVSTCGEMVKSN
jgi:hypothetical protein